MTGGGPFERSWDCPTGFIGCLGDDDAKPVMDDFPLHVDGGVYYCGYNSPTSYGGNNNAGRESILLACFWAVLHFRPWRKSLWFETEY